MEILALCRMLTAYFDFQEIDIMSYLGENSYLSFRDNFCEPLPGISMDSSIASASARKAASFFKRFAVGCSSERLKHFLYSFCAGIAECGKDVFICENTDLPSFKFGFPLTASDCGIFLSGSDALRISFFDGNGFPLNSKAMSEIMNSPENITDAQCGKITHISSFRNIYINNIRDILGERTFPLCAGISCGNREIRILWQEFFNDADDTLIFQVSDDGQRVNAYSTELGFISYDRLVLAYCIMLWKKGQTVWLPENFHFAADNMAESNSYRFKKFSIENTVPEEAAEQRFLNDPLFLCTTLVSNRDSFLKSVAETPKFTSAKRDLCVNLNSGMPYDKAIIEPNGKVFISKSGKNRISLVAQAYDSETAAELCSEWDRKLKLMCSCNNLFH